MEIEAGEKLEFGEDIDQDDLLDEEFDAIEQFWQEEVIGSQDSIQTADRTTSSGSSDVPSQPADKGRISGPKIRFTWLIAHSKARKKLI